MADTSYGTVRAPDFPQGLSWLNTGRALSLKQDLKGKFVLLDFWTYCCINCMHILPDLKKLERKYRNELVVIGVHSAKFENERETENIRQAILRYNIEHPVLNDAGFRLWQQYSVRAWPTLFLIDPRGYIVGYLSGEGIYEPFDRLLQKLIPQFEADGTLDRTPLPLILEQRREPQHTLSFPGKIIADPENQRLFISDTNHHRILIIDTSGRVLLQIGSGRAGPADGDVSEAEFRQPQGTFYDAFNDLLYVADTENHALRRVDLDEQRVDTLAGNGKQAPFRASESIGPGSPLNSPWDVWLHEERLYVAMAGPHQIWVFDPTIGSGQVYAGSGRENIVDAPRLDAQLAQPSGLTSDGAFLYFADSETSAVRRVGFGDEQVVVETLIGQGLFEFGDVDGKAPEARLQHPLGVAYHDGVLYVADSYNHKIKQLDPTAGTLTTLVGTGQPGYVDGDASDAQLSEPGGVVVLGDRLFIADTNNHRIRYMDLQTGKTGTLNIVEPTVASGPSREQSISYPNQQVAPGIGRVTLQIALPVGMKPNPEVPATLNVLSSNEAVIEPDAAPPLTDDGVLQIPCTFAEGHATLSIEGPIYYCDDKGKRCFVRLINIMLQIQVRSGVQAQDLVLKLRVDE